MKQIIQDLKKGDTLLEEVPVPEVNAGEVLIKTTKSLVSLGTERMLVDFGKANYLDKARQQPDKVKMVLDKVKTDGLKPTIDSVRNKLDHPLPLGYCNVGEVVAVGKDVTEFNIGDRVASNGKHAEYVSVPKNLVAKVPDNVTDEEASFTVIGSIALQGIRLANPTFGENFVVIGLGLIGLITAEILKSNGCNVVGIDFDEQKIELAKQKGITTINPSEGSDPVNFVKKFTDDTGADGVIITASSKSNDIIHQAAEMSRKRGRVILVGVIGLNLKREDFYEKELTFQVSCSYGPGRYDEDYEEKGQDYPVGYVRWTEKRNFQAILDALAKGRLDVQPLITERVDLENYGEIYNDMSKPGSIASVINFNSAHERQKVIQVESKSTKPTSGNIGIIGAGNFTSATILPKLKKLNANIEYIASGGGLTAKTLAKKYNISNATTDYSAILKDESVDLALITTRHNLHAKMAVEAINAGKHVFVEKPLALNESELENIVEAFHTKNKNASQPISLTVGFNRRFAPLAEKMRKLIGTENIPVNIIATMNAGYIPPEMWVHDPEIGGGRIIGEACHFIDLCTFLTGSRVSSVSMNALGTNPKENTDNGSILLKYENGSNAVINYFSNGNKAYSKERLEVFSQQRTLVMDNWRKLKGYGFKGFNSKSTSQDKGHYNQFKYLLQFIQKGGEPIIPFEEIVNTTKASFAAIESMKEGKWINLE
jgi:predicted dehydrogenase/threonine dehydrogenase-like Zn-dependent dehydrogenase